MRCVRLVPLAVVLLAIPAFAEEKKDVDPKSLVGKPAPDITLPATQVEKVLPDKADKKTLSLKDFQGKKNVVLFFYPKAMTKGCTIESCGFRDVTDDFAKLDTVVIGISTDKLDAQNMFTEKEKLNFPLIADPEKKATESYGALNKNGFASRYTYVIDKKGVVRQVYTDVKPGDHPKEVLTYVKENLK
jgi:thioredoxin-dependent peroxiredoxin